MILNKDIMKKFNSTLIFTIAFLSVIVLIVILTGDVSFAQPPGLPAAPSQAPIDGGLSFLAAASGVYAYKKLKKERK